MNYPARILIVDDSQAVRSAVAHMLRSADYELSEAVDGTEALRLARANRPDLILLDIVLPDLDGAEVRRQIRDDQSLRGVLVVHLSAQRTSVEDRVQGLRGGADGYLSWPITQAEMVATVEAFLRIRRTEVALRASAEQHQAILETAMDGFWLADAEGRLLEVNETYCRMSGYSAGELLSMRIGDLDAVEPPAATSARMQQIIARGEGRFESRHRRKDGTVFDVEGSVQYRPTHGGRFVVFVRDITDRLLADELKAALEAQLQESQKMESVGRLAGGVAHDFNNMLGVIIGHVEMAMDEADPDEPLHADLQAILQAAHRSADLTRQLLAFARKQAIAPRVHDLNDAVAGMHSMLQRMVGENFPLKFNPEPQLWPAKADSAQINQILTNLCVNARDASAGGGTITIETANCTLDAEFCATRPGFIPGDFVRLAVRDDGCGMDPATLGHIFEPFFTTKGVGEGTGLGLATVYGAVRQNSGFVHVDSEPDKGTTVAIYLPRHLGQVGGSRPAHADLVARGEATVLLVEDEPAILAMTTRILSGHGYTVLPASSPGGAMQAAQAHSGEIHLLITDVIMPEMNGRKLAKQVLSLYPSIRRLFMSGYTADVIAQHGVLDSGVHFIQKPFTRRALLAKVAEVLGSE